jgi:hypothetical protein
MFRGILRWLPEAVCAAAAVCLVLTMAWSARATQDGALMMRVPKAIQMSENCEFAVTAPADITVGGASIDPVTTGYPTVVAVCRPYRVRYSDMANPGGCPQDRTIRRTWTVTDAAGQAQTCVQTITVEDNTPPEITCPPDAHFECDDIGDFGVATATDNLDLEPTVTYRDTVIFYRCPYEYTFVRTWTATDDCGNSASCDQTITIEDSTPPVMVCPRDTTVACDQWNDAGWAYALDTCNPYLGMSYEPVSVANVERWHNRVIRSWEVTDSCCNLAYCRQVVTLVDTVAPTIVCDPPDTIPCLAPVVFRDPTVTDNCASLQEISLEIMLSDTVPGPEGYDRTFTRCWAARDNFGNLSATSCQDIVMRRCAQSMCTFTMAAWGTPCPDAESDNLLSTHPGCILDHYFDEVFPDGVTIGGVGIGPFTARWTSAAAVGAFLPASGLAGLLTVDLIDPLVTPAGELAGEVLALRLNREFSCAGVFARLGIAPEGECYGDYVIPADCDPNPDVRMFAGLSVDQILAIGDEVVGGNPLIVCDYRAMVRHLLLTLRCLNRQFNECEVAVLGVPERAPGSAGPEAGPVVEPGLSEAFRGGAPGTFGVSRIYPNPLTTSAAIDFGVPSEGRVTVEIYDVRGVKVTTLADAEEPMGYHHLVWNGTDSAGRPVVRGVYFCRIRFAGEPPVMEKLIKME